MSDSLLPVPLGGNLDRGPQLIKVAWSECFFAIWLVGLRIYTRLKYTHRLWWDDWVMVITLVLIIIYSTLWTVYSLDQGGRHVYYLLPEQQMRTTRLNWISQPFVITAIGTGKISVALLLLRILGPSKWRKWLLYFIISSTLIVVSIAIILSFVQCSPVTKLWNPAVQGHCWDPSIQEHEALFASAYLAFEDFVLAALPLTIVWNLQLNWMKKFGLAGLMGLGVFAGACAIIKTTKIPELTARSDFTWETVELLIWNGNEVFTIVVAACIPTIRPLFLDLSAKTISIICYKKPIDRTTVKDEETHKLERIPKSSHARNISSRGSSQDFFLDATAPAKTLPIKQTTEWTVGSHAIDQNNKVAAGGVPTAFRKPLSADDRV